VCITFCANLGKSATETLTMIQQSFGDQSLRRARVFQWHARFKTGRISFDDDAYGEPQVAQLLKLLHEFNGSSVRIEFGPFTTLLRRRELVLEHAKWSDGKIGEAPPRSQICGQDPGS
jgi:hypothetical protein